jgi:predicted Zn-dependent protease with MMP-like domain
MKRVEFQKLVEQALDTLPEKYHRLVENLAVVIEDHPPEEGPPGIPKPRDTEDLLMGIYDGVPLTERSFFSGEPMPGRVVLYQQNIEAYARAAAAEEGRPVEEVIREEVRLTVLHELGHYFGMDEEQLEDV